MLQNILQKNTFFRWKIFSFTLAMLEKIIYIHLKYMAETTFQNIMLLCIKN